VDDVKRVGGVGGMEGALYDWGTRIMAGGEASLYQCFQQVSENKKQKGVRRVDQRMVFKSRGLRRAAAGGIRGE